MANTIKLKRGSGSDPSASDLAVGEVAVRTDEGKLFTKKDDGSVAEISGGGGIDDGEVGGADCLLFERTRRRRPTHSDADIASVLSDRWGTPLCSHSPCRCS